MLFTVLLCIFSLHAIEVRGHGLLLLYRPRDISSECASSHQLRYDISYGMGMSDTMTLVFRTMQQVDYQCAVDIVTAPANTTIIAVIRFPTSLSINCGANPDAFTVMKKQGCIRVCDSLGDRDLSSPYFVAAVKGRLRFTFLSNSSINADIKARLYQVTVTSARSKPKKGCAQWNETTCSVGRSDYCFTTGVVCDGINNCGVTDWFDERKSQCSLPIERLGFAPVVAVGAAVMCALLAAGHILLRFLPPLANSFFIFNANEDNRLCVDPLFESPGMRASSMDKVRKISLIPVSSSSSENTQLHDLKSTDSQGLQLLTDDSLPNLEETYNMTGQRQGTEDEALITERVEYAVPGLFPEQGEAELDNMNLLLEMRATVITPNPFYARQEAQNVTANLHVTQEASVIHLTRDVERELAFMNYLLVPRASVIKPTMFRARQKAERVSVIHRRP